MALHSIDIQCVDARIPEGVEHALLLGGPVRRCEACGPAVADHAPAGDAADARLVGNDQVLVNLLRIGLQAHAATHLASHIAVCALVEGQTSTSRIHPAVVSRPHERREGQEDTSNDSCAAVSSALDTPGVGGRNCRRTHHEGNGCRAHLAIDRGAGTHHAQGERRSVGGDGLRASCTRASARFSVDVVPLRVGGASEDSDVVVHELLLLVAGSVEGLVARFQDVLLHWIHALGFHDRYAEELRVK
mmetsp:Transcript_45011/g.114110  ORF Transcript_45011/g.114110 Transcript_45011/m.114110 type:complete len:246 (+) Transcript_45011:1347-2084(+)